MNQIINTLNYDINRMTAVDLISVIHIDDHNTRFIELVLSDQGSPFSVTGSTVIARFVTVGGVLLSDNVSCTVTEDGNILIPIDAAAVNSVACDLKIEVNITQGSDVLTLPFPLWVRVRGSILDNAEATPETEGKISDLLKEAEEQLERVKALENGKSAYEIAVDNGFSGTEAEWLLSLKGDKGDSVSSAVVNQNGTITFTLDDGSTFTTSGSSVIGPQGAPGNDYVLTEQDKAVIAGMVDISGKADKATTLAGYGITDAYTKTQTGTLLNAKESTANKVTAVNSSASDTQYPSAKAVFDFGADILDDVNEEISDTNADIADLKAYIGYTDGDILGLHADFENKVFTRLAGAVGKTAGSDFDSFQMYGGRRRCCVADNGTINAYYGEQGYTEDGTNGQVMVYQPKFYYRMMPLKLEKQASGLGYHIRKANYYVTANPRPGFKLHPLFYDANGNELDYVLLSAYEGSMYDVSESAYVNDNVDSITYASGDLLCSVSGKKPISGKLTGIGTKGNLEAMAQNRGTGWHLDTIRSVAANQLLMMIEFGKLDFQACIGMGVVNKTTGESTKNNSEMTGQSQPNTETGTTAYSAESAPISYRWLENPWGNIWKHVQGINDWGNGSMHGGQLYICSDFDFSESKHTGNYKQSGFALYNGAGYISGFGYGAEEFDWLMIASDKGGNDTLPVGDFSWSSSNINGYKIMCYGGMWLEGNSSPLPKRFGGFCTDCTRSNDFSRNYIGGRLLYVPTANISNGSDYILTAQDKSDIANIVLGLLPTTQGVQYGN